jgi:Domain of unknown function (DUF4465)/PEP-CTERM motif
VRHLTTLALILVATSASRASYVTTTFENFNLAPNSYLNNAGMAGGFLANGNFFNNSYDKTYGTWSGWAISNTTDTTTPGYTNQYSAITGSGAGGSATYAVAYTFGATANPFNPAGSYLNLANGTTPVSLEVTNTTYPYLSMLNGDSFENPFGPGDFFLLTVTGYSGLNGTGGEVGEKNFYLADFIGSNRYIVDTWQTLDLTSLAGAKSLVFGLSSSENDPTYGMNTPAYFAVDNLVTNVSTVPAPSSLILMAFGLVGGACFILRKRHTATELTAKKMGLTQGVTV